ncbi:MAG: MFS transporter [Deltaproteobacteria bacterium]|nr:MFS transporter [Deltaproteobacteria bacterium]
MTPPHAFETAKKRTEGIGTFASLRHADYLYLWVGNLFNTSGMWIQQVTVGWLVWKLSGSATLVGIASGLRFLPFLFMGPLGGVAADRMDRRRLLLMTQLLTAVAAVLFAVVVALDWVRVWHALVFSLVMGCGVAMNAPVRQSLIVNTVPREELGNAVALHATAINATRVIGPAIGGVLIVTLGMAGNFLLQAGLYLCTVAIIFPMQVPYRDPLSASKESALRSLQEGIRYIWNDKSLFGMMLLSFIPALFVMPILQIMPAFTEDVLHAQANIYGYLITSYGVGALAATLTMASFGNVIRSGSLGIAALLASAVFVIFFSQCTWLWAAFFLLAATGFCVLIFRVNNTTLVQAVVPDALRGRVMSLYQIDHALMPLSSSALGICADVFSVPASIAASGVLCLLVTGGLLLGVKQIRDLRKL